MIDTTFETRSPAGWRRALLVFGSMMALSLVGSAPSEDAWAQGTSADAALAEDLYQRGLALEKEGKVAEACPKLDESYRLDPQPGTLVELAGCLDKAGKTASAKARYQEMLALAVRLHNDKRVAEAQAKLAELEPRLNHLVLVVAPEIASIAGLELRRNGAPVPRAAWGEPLTIDPGVQEIEATAPGKQRWMRRVPVSAPGGNDRVEVTGFVDAPPSPTPSAPPAGTLPPPQEGGSLGTQKIAGYALSGVGVVGAVMGVVLWGQASSQHSSANTKASGCLDPGCYGDAQSSNESAKSLAKTGTVLVALGGVLAGSGVALLLTAPSRSGAETGATWVRLSPQLGRSSGGLSLGGAW